MGGNPTTQSVSQVTESVDPCNVRHAQELDEDICRMKDSIKAGDLPNR